MTLHKSVFRTLTAVRQYKEICQEVQNASIHYSKTESSRRDILSKQGKTKILSPNFKPQNPNHVGNLSEHSQTLVGKEFSQVIGTMVKSPVVKAKAYQK